MPTISMPEWLCHELHFEPAIYSLLATAGQPMVSAFLTAVTKDGTPIDLQSVNDDSCFAVFEPGRKDPNVRAWRTPPGGDESSVISELAGFTGTIIVTRRVPVGDLPAKEGEVPGCYAKLLRELGIIRAALLETETPFRTLMPLHDILTIDEDQPNRAIDGPRSANQITLRFPVTYMPRVGAW